MASDEKAKSNSFRSNHLSTNHLISVLAVVPVEEQEKYYKEILQNCDEDVNQIIRYTRSLDKSLQGEIFIEAITKAREITEKDEFYRTNNNFRYVELMKSFEPELMVDNFINILNGDINDPNFKLIFDLLSEKEIKQIIEPYLQSKQIITEEQLKLLKEMGFFTTAYTLVGMPSTSKKTFKRTVKMCKYFIGKELITDCKVPAIYVPYPRDNFDYLPDICL